MLPQTRNTKRNHRSLAPLPERPSPPTGRTESRNRTSLDFASPEPLERRNPLHCKILRTTAYLAILRHRRTPHAVRILRRHIPQPSKRKPSPCIGRQYECTPDPI